MWCWVCQWTVSRCLDDGCPLPGWAERHVRQCDRCGAFHQRVDWLAAGLEREAVLSQRPLRDNVRNRILAAISEGPHQRSRMPRLGPYALAAACLALAGLMLVTALVLRKSREADDYGRAVAQIREALSAGGIPSQSPNGVYTAIVSQAITSPLASELKAMTEDTRSAARFLTTCVAMDVQGMGAGEGHRD